MRNHAGRLLRTIALLLVQAADRLDPQPPAPQPGSFTVHSGTGTTTYEPRTTWHQTEYATPRPIFPSPMNPKTRGNQSP